jgi:hypothetical protein
MENIIFQILDYFKPIKDTLLAFQSGRKSLFLGLFFGMYSYIFAALIATIQKPFEFPKIPSLSAQQPSSPLIVISIK